MSGILRIRFADDSARKVEELSINRFEEGEECEGMLEFGIDRLFEDGEEFLEGALKGVAGSFT